MPLLYILSVQLQVKKKGAKATAFSNAVAYVRFTMDDVRFANNAQRSCGNLAAGTPPMYEVQHARRPQAAARQLLIYDVGCTTVADGVCLCTTYDVRWTIAMFGAGGAGRGRKRLCTMDDVRRWRLTLPMDDVRCTKSTIILRRGKFLFLLNPLEQSRACGGAFSLPTPL